MICQKFGVVSNKFVQLSFAGVLFISEFGLEKAHFCIAGTFFTSIDEYTCRLFGGSSPGLEQIWPAGSSTKMCQLSARRGLLRKALEKVETAVYYSRHSKLIGQGFFEFSSHR